MKRAVSIEDVAREYLRAKSASLEEQLEVSCFVEKVKREMREQKAGVEPIGVTDKARGWRLTQES